MQFAEVESKGPNSLFSLISAFFATSKTICFFFFADHRRRRRRRKTSTSLIKGLDSQGFINPKPQVSSSLHFSWLCFLFLIPKDLRRQIKLIEKRKRKKLWKICKKIDWEWMKEQKLDDRRRPQNMSFNVLDHFPLFVTVDMDFEVDIGSWSHEALSCCLKKW